MPCSCGAELVANPQGSYACSASGAAEGQCDREPATTATVDETPAVTATVEEEPTTAEVTSGTTDDSGAEGAPEVGLPGAVEGTGSGLVPGPGQEPPA
jgi:hypothetical protein